MTTGTPAGSAMPTDPQPRYLSFRLFDALVPVVIAIIVLIVGYLQSNVKLTFPTIAAGISLGLISASLGFVGAYFCFRRLSADLTSRLLAAVSRGVGPAHLRSVLFDDREILEFERSVDCEEIWIVSSDMHMDAPDSDAIADSRPTVLHNIKSRGVRYVFIVPDEVIIRRKVAQRLLAGLSPREAQAITVEYLPLQDFKKMPYLDGNIAIYNPTRRPITTASVVIFEVPHHARVWCALPESIGDRWIARICEVVPVLNEEKSPPKETQKPQS